MRHREIAILILAIVVCVELFSFMPTLLGVRMGGDWFGFFRPRVLHIERLYEQGPTSYAPWTFVPLIPVALLPPQLGYGVLLTCSVAVLVACTGKWWRALLLVACWPVMDGLQLGHLDALLSIVFLLPLDWALVLVSMKPIVLWPWALLSVQKATNNDWRMLASIMSKLVIIAIVSLLIRGWWPAKIELDQVGMPYPQICTWPHLIPIGVYFMTRKKERAWLIAGLFLTPYLNPYHLTPILAYVYRNEDRWWVLALITAATWLPVIL